MAFVVKRPRTRGRDTWSRDLSLGSKDTDNAPFDLPPSPPLLVGVLRTLSELEVAAPAFEEVALMLGMLSEALLDGEADGIESLISNPRERAT